MSATDSGGQEEDADDQSVPREGAAPGGALGKGAVPLSAPVQSRVPVPLGWEEGVGFQ